MINKANQIVKTDMLLKCQIKIKAELTDRKNENYQLLKEKDFQRQILVLFLPL